MAKPKPAKPAKPAPKAAAAAVARRAKIGIEKDKPFVINRMVTFRVYGDSIGRLNPNNKSVCLTAKKYFWSHVTHADAGDHGIDISGKPHRIKRRTYAWDTDDDLTVTVILDEGTANEETIDCTFEDVEYQDPP